MAGIEQLELPLTDRAEAEAAAYAREYFEHLASMRLCWPEWDGPRVEDSIHGRCNVGSCAVHSEKHGRMAYHYCAPAKIIELLSGGGCRAVIDYPPDAPEHCLADNGEIVRLDALDVWPPTDELWKLRRNEERKN